MGDGEPNFLIRTILELNQNHGARTNERNLVKIQILIMRQYLYLEHIQILGFRLKENSSSQIGYVLEPIFNSEKDFGL